MYLSTILDAVDGQADRLEMLLARRLARQHGAGSGKTQQSGSHNKRASAQRAPSTTFVRSPPRTTLNRFVLHTPLSLSSSEEASISSSSRPRVHAPSAPPQPARYFSSAYSQQLQQFAIPMPETPRPRPQRRAEGMHQLHAHDALVAHLRAAGVLRAAETHVAFAPLAVEHAAALPAEPLPATWQLEVGAEAAAEEEEDGATPRRPRSVPMQRECPLAPAPAPEAWEGAWLDLLPLAAAHEAQQARCPILGTQRWPRRAKL